MRSRSRDLVAPAYLFSCLILGGSAQGIWQNMVLQLAGIAIIAWAAMRGDDRSFEGSASQLLLIAVLAMLVIALQLIPLPPSIWTHLGSRARIGEDFHILGIHVPAEPVSLTPHLGLASLLGIIPPLAVFCAIVRLKAYRPLWMAIALLAGTFAGICLGALQVASGNPLESPFYLYDDTNGGKAVGFFANADHMATLLVISIPFLAALLSAEKSAAMQRYSAVLAIVIAAGLVILVGIALNGSLAGYLLSLPVIAASALVIVQSRKRLHLAVISTAILLLIGAIAALQVTSIGSSKIGQHASSAAQSRSDLITTTSRAVAEFMPLGSGLGSFSSIYPLYENPKAVGETYVVHAHNDYLELALELGLPGIFLMALFLAWWTAAVVRAWRRAGPFARAGSIASAAILVHSLVDFPLRTAAIAACFAFCIALLAECRVGSPEQESDRISSRHVVIK